MDMLSKSSSYASASCRGSVAGFVSQLLEQSRWQAIEGSGLFDSEDGHQRGLTPLLASDPCWLPNWRQLQQAERDDAFGYILRLGGNPFKEFDMTGASTLGEIEVIQIASQCVKVNGLHSTEVDRVSFVDSSTLSDRQSKKVVFGSSAFATHSMEMWLLSMTV